MSYYIQHSDTRLVAGFSKAHQIVQWTTAACKDEYAKPFKTIAAAMTWASKYVNAGYGLTQGTFSIVEL